MEGQGEKKRAPPLRDRVLSAVKYKHTGELQNKACDIEKKSRLCVNINNTATIACKKTLAFARQNSIFSPSILLLSLGTPVINYFLPWVKLSLNGTLVI